MLVRGSEIKDECSKCGRILECELFLDGHAIHRERDHFTEMIKCQMEHRKRREDEEKK